MDYICHVYIYTKTSVDMTRLCLTHVILKYDTSYHLDHFYKWFRAYYFYVLWQRIENEAVSTLKEVLCTEN